MFSKISTTLRIMGSPNEWFGDPLNLPILGSQQAPFWRVWAAAESSQQSGLMAGLKKIQGSQDSKSNRLKTREAQKHHWKFKNVESLTEPEKSTWFAKGINHLPNSPNLHFWLPSWFSPPSGQSLVYWGILVYHPNLIKWLSHHRFLLRSKKQRLSGWILLVHVAFQAPQDADAAVAEVRLAGKTHFREPIREPPARSEGCQASTNIHKHTLPETHSLHLKNRGFHKRRVVFQASFSSGLERTVGFRGPVWFRIPAVNPGLSRTSSLIHKRIVNNNCLTSRNLKSTWNQTYNTWRKSHRSYPQTLDESM